MIQNKTGEMVSKSDKIDRKDKARKKQYPSYVT